MLQELTCRNNTINVPCRAKAEVSVLAKFSDIDAHINPNWPAVKWRRFGNQVQYFPMELLKVDPNQRVPLEKQINARCVSNTNSFVSPTKRTVDVSDPKGRQAGYSTQ